MGSGCSFRVVLNRERWNFEAAKPLNDVVVEAIVAHFDTTKPEGRLDDSFERSVHGEAMVLRGNLDATTLLVEDGLVDAAVTEWQLVRAKSECATQKLIAKTNTEIRYSPPQQGLEERYVHV